MCMYYHISKMNKLHALIYSVIVFIYSKTCVKRQLKHRQNKEFNNNWKLNEGLKYCRMLPLEHSAILLTCIKLPFVIKIFVLSIFEWPIYTGFTVL